MDEYKHYEQQRQTRLVENNSKIRKINRVIYRVFYYTLMIAFFGSLFLLFRYFINR